MSVVIACYNQADFLAEAVESVAAQGLDGVETVIVDDGSTDATPTVACRYPWARCIQQQNQGPGAARNTGLHTSRGEYVVFLDADDRLLPGAIEAGLSSLTSHPRSAFTFGSFRRIAADGGVMIERSVRGRFDAQDAFGSLLGGNHVGMLSTALFRRSMLLEVGGFDETLMLCQDYDLFLRLTHRFPAVHHAALVAEYRQHEGNRSADPAAMLTAVLRVIDAHADHGIISARHRRAYHGGVRAWRDYYGERMLDRCRAQAAEGRWRDAGQTLARTVRLCGTRTPAVLVLSSLSEGLRWRLRAWHGGRQSR